MIIKFKNFKIKKEKFEITLCNYYIYILIIYIIHIN